MPKIIKVGKYLGITLAKGDLEALGLREGDEVIVQRKGEVLEVMPLATFTKNRG